MFGLAGPPGLSRVSGVVAYSMMTDAIQFESVRPRTQFTPLTPPKIRKEFPETFIFETLNETR